jgi:hypothetical protein
MPPRIVEGRKTKKKEARREGKKGEKGGKPTTELII